MLEPIDPSEYPTVQITLSGEVVKVKARTPHTIETCAACGEEYFDESIIEGLCDDCLFDVEEFDEDDD